MGFHPGKTIAGAPQYTLRIRDWKTDVFTDADTSVFRPPAGATKVDLDASDMAELDELPPGSSCAQVVDAYGRVTTRC
jgi:hypothetical protein